MLVTEIRRKRRPAPGLNNTRAAMPLVILISMKKSEQACVCEMFG